MISRRNFFKNLSLFFSGSFFGKFGNLFGSGNGKKEKKVSAKKMAVLMENSIEKEYDLIVVGSGISGTSAAISAARNGMKVALVHNRAMFGGNASSEVKLYPENNSGHDPWIKEGGIHDEFHTEERIRNHDYYQYGAMNAHWDLVLYEWVIKEKNITPYLNTHMHKVFMDNDSRIESILAIQLGTEKSFNLSAPLFVESTGDGVLGALANADHRWGRESKSEYNEPLAPEKADENVMGNTQYFTARDTGKPVPFKRPEWAAEFKTEEDLYARGHHALGPEGTATYGGHWWIEIGAPYHPIKDMNEARHEGLRQLLGVWDHIKNKGDHGAENYGLEFACFWPYKRASRRIIGDYVVTQHDVQDPQQLHDAVAYGCWHIDIHVQGGILARKKRPYPPGGRDVNWQDLNSRVYGIPIRSLYSRNIENLLMAGRPISTSYLGFASTRVLSTGSICGQAVGVIAAIAKKYNTIPKEVSKSHASEVQQIILRQDGHIPGVENTDEHDLARKANTNSSSNAKMVFPEPNGERELSWPHAQLFPASSGRIDQVELLLRSTRSTSTTVRLGLRQAAHVWDFRNKEDIAVVEATVPANSEQWVTFNLNREITPGKLYYVYTDKQPGIYWKSFGETDGEPNQVPIGTTAAYLPDKTPYSEKSTTFKEIYSPVEMKDIPGSNGEGHWKPLTRGRSLCLRVSPECRPYTSDNIIRGTNRPDMWSNIWVSSPEEGLPASVELAWDSKVEFNTLQLTFDTDQNKRVTLPLFAYPDCVKDYVVEYYTESSWNSLVSIEENYMRRRVHQFDPVRTNRLRVRVLATNGAPVAKIYEVRVYNEG